MSNKSYKYLKLNGKVGVVINQLNSTSAIDLNKRLDFRILLVGPTGSGKSSFIEALADDRKMGISKNQLEGFTQTVTAYELVNIKNPRGGGFSLLDCPGFSDSNLSEMEIIEMVKKWMSESEFGFLWLHAVLYFYPITDTRLPGTRRKTMEMLKALIKSSSRGSSANGNQNEGAVTIVTTMWDQVWCERLEQRAEERYTQLKDGVWKEMVEKGAGITKFMNTQESALDILDEVLDNWRKTYGVAYDIKQMESAPLKETGHGLFLYQDLISRIAMARQRQTAVQLEEEASADEPALKVLFQEEHKQLARLLEKYEQQLTLFVNPPEPTGADLASSLILPSV
ncbi:hypothetical protein CVT24_013351 [Panaeolus cyanescens]|uniref:G domain-containing protein n=1 Tax=Panaeolus cyanescens TaxID=181874 RepID=A0A409WD63_9AGAR|nr:hypothetical protein CVT24_013351 [Panaeolus cyanescens]